MTYLLVFLALATLLGLTVLRRVLWWITVVLPIAGYVGWMTWHDSVFAWGMAATLVLVALAGNEVARENGRRTAAGKPPMTKAEIRSRYSGL